MALVIAPTVIVGIALGLHYGPKGVAIGYSMAMTILLLPMITWAIHDTGITSRDYWRTARKPLIAGLLAAACGLSFKVAISGALSPVWLLGSGMVVCTGIYGWILVSAMGQKELYLELQRHIFERVRTKQQTATII